MPQDIPFSEQLEKNLKSAESWVENTKSNIRREEEDWKEADEKINDLIRESSLFDQHRTDRKIKIKELLVDLEKERKSIPWLKRTLGKENKLYKCVTNKIERGHRPKACGDLSELPEEIRTNLNLYTNYWIYDDTGALEAKALRASDLKSQINKKERAQKGLARQKARLVFWENELEVAKKKKNDYVKFQVAGINERRCSPNTPTIDLEKDGVFKDLPFDHQDDVGTCFANVGKNLLYAATKGESNASFLDMALQYTKVLESDALYEVDGGTACSAINVVKETGICDRSNSPLENGEPSFDLGLIGKADSVQAHSGGLEKLSILLKAKANLIDKSAKESSLMAAKAIRLLQEDKNIDLPFPKLERTPFNQGPIYLYYSNKYPSEKKKENPHSVLYREIEDLKKEIENKIIKQILKDPSFLTGNKLDELVKSAVMPLFEKYELPEETRKLALSEWNTKELKKMDGDKFLKKVNSTVRFYNEISGEKDVFGVDRLTDPACAVQDRKLLHFGKAVSDMVDYAGRMEIPLERMISDDKLLPNAELLQLALAPKCLNPANRKRPANGVVCSDTSLEDATKNYGVSKEEFVFFKALEGLKKGMPLGNSFKSGSKNHINTIVGVRYDPDSGSCQFKIRESMTASSYWKDAGAISNKMYNLTEVRGQ